ncbi:MAG: terminase [Betaproteobacteria bacterium RIFCSPLOWO2_12_FULL_65_14]|nr:MAG: terminase [Betaproteobacteria bacterium RIFCSPLOWO2_12_FULL_65_14]
MGLRGPGAKPKAKRKAKASKSNLPAWKVCGASRFERVVAFIESLPITSGLLAGTKFRLRPWQRDILKGIYRTDQGGRRVVRQALITMPRKNGKTGLTAALALAHLCGPEAEQRGQVYSAAADRAQAALIFQEMKAIIERVPALEKRIITRDFTKSFEDIETGSTYAALSSDAKTKHGFSASCWIYDELAQAPDRRLYDVLSTSTAARAEPLGIVISTQSSDPHSIMSELVDYGQQILDSVLEDEHFYPVIFTAPEDADPWSEMTWGACNPALGDFRSIEELRIAALQAQRMPAREPTFRLLYLNQRVSAESRLIPPGEWKACAGAIDVEALRGRPCWAGLDLGSTTDLTALVLFFAEDGGAVVPYFWVPRDRLEERERGDRVPYPLWHKEGYIEAPAGRAIDRVAIIRRLAEIAATFDLRGIAFDRWRLEDLKKLLSDEGIDIEPTAWGQGFKDMGPSVDALEAAILDRKLKHADHPVLTWNCWNAIVEIDPTGARKIDKAKSTERVDGMVALAMAIGLHARTPKAEASEPAISVLTA